MFLLRRKENNTLVHDRREFRLHLKQLLGRKPANLRLYEMAFIHRSASYIMPDGTRINNERLEYLGDAIIDGIISDYLFHHYPEASEGLLTKARARIVSRETLNQLGISMKLDNLIISNLSSANTPPNLFGNALEALIGVLFIDTGYTRTSRFFIDKVLKKYLNLDEVLTSETDYKSLILEYCQKNKMKLHYSFQEIPDQKNSHPQFRVTLEINTETIAQGEGASKKEAEQEASMIAWNKTVIQQI
ncbi:MAG: ribonuclease III [Bacteroidales bacterium]